MPLQLVTVKKPIEEIYLVERVRLAERNRYGSYWSDRDVRMYVKKGHAMQFFNSWKDHPDVDVRVYRIRLGEAELLNVNREEGA